MSMFKTSEGRLKRWARILTIVSSLLTGGAVIAGGSITVYEWATPAPECFDE